MIVLNGLPMPYHPVFNVPRFERASRDKFFLLVESADPKFDREQTRDFLKGLNPARSMKLSRNAMRDARCAMRVSMRCRCLPARRGRRAAGRTCTTRRRRSRCARACSSRTRSSARPLVEGTVARGTLQDDAAFFTGKSGGVALDALPFALDRGGPRPRRAALQHLLRAVPRPVRRAATG